MNAYGTYHGWIAESLIKVDNSVADLSIVDLLNQYIAIHAIICIPSIYTMSTRDAGYIPPDTVHACYAAAMQYVPDHLMLYISPGHRVRILTV